MFLQVRIHFIKKVIMIIKWNQKIKFWIKKIFNKILKWKKENRLVLINKNIKVHKKRFYKIICKIKLKNKNLHIISICKIKIKKF